MPTYEYVCSACETAFDRICPMDQRDDAIGEACQNCSTQGSIKRVLSTVGFVRQNPFKGLSSDFKYAMNNMKKRHRGNTIPDY